MTSSPDPSGRGPLEFAPYPNCMTTREFQVFRDLVHRETGIALGPHKRTLLEARLTKRLRALGLTSFSAYHDYLEHEDPRGEERTRFVNAITTNETAFFRERDHFTYLAGEWLAARRAAGADRRLRIWSAACSTGEEPYSIAMALLGAIDDARTWDIRILATDIDTNVLARAEVGIYRAEAVAPVPPALVPRFFLRGRAERVGLVRVRPEVRALVTFRRLSLLDPGWPHRTAFDFVFCRNVLMYFDRPTQGHIVQRFERVLAPHGLLVLGHAENVVGLDTTMRRVSGTIYRRAPADG